MKKLVTTIFVIGALISNNKIYANGNSSIPTEKPAKNLQVSFDNVNIGSTLFVKDKKGQVLYSENIGSEGTYKRRFDFSMLPENEYYFEVDKKAFISIYPFTVTEEYVQIHEEKASEIVKPLLLVENNQVKLMRNIDQKQRIKIAIYYNGQELVFRETVDKDGMIGRLYDFSTAISGDYLFSIEYEDRFLSENININTIY